MRPETQSGLAANPTPSSRTGLGVQLAASINHGTATMIRAALYTAAAAVFMFGVSLIEQHDAAMATCQQSHSYATCANSLR